MMMMTSTSPNARSILFSSPGLHEGSIKGDSEKERKDSVSSTIPSHYEEMSEDGRIRRATWEKCKASKNRSICLWVMLAFVVYVITLVFIFGSEQNLEFARLPLLWTFQLEKLQQIATVILQVSDVYRRMYRVSAAFRDNETNVTTMKFMTGEELEVSSEMAKLSDSKGVTIAYWDFKNGRPTSSLNAAVEEEGGSSNSSSSVVEESGEAVKIPTPMPSKESQSLIEGILSPRRLGNQFLDYIIGMKKSALDSIGRYANTILGLGNKGGSTWNLVGNRGGSIWKSLSNKNNSIHNSSNPVNVPCNKRGSDRFTGPCNNVRRSRYYAVPSRNWYSYNYSRHSYGNDMLGNGNDRQHIYQPYRQQNHQPQHSINNDRQHVHQQWY